REEARRAPVGRHQDRFDWGPQLFWRNKKETASRRSLLLSYVVLCVCESIAASSRDRRLFPFPAQAEDTHTAETRREKNKCARQRSGSFDHDGGSKLSPLRRPVAAGIKTERRQDILVEDPGDVFAVNGRLRRQPVLQTSADRPIKRTERQRIE